MVFGALLVAASALLCWHVRRCRARSSRLALAFVLAATLLSWPPVAWLAAGTLEWQLGVRTLPEQPPEAIVVLSGYVYPPRPWRPEPVLGRDTYVRLEHALWLARRFPQAPILVCGGRLPGEPDAPPFADVMRRYLVRNGVPPARIWTEARSTNTHTNAVYGAQILRRHGVTRPLLVTEALHMPRAAACFRHEGIAVRPAPCHPRAAEFDTRAFASWWPAPAAARLVGRVLHEWVGLAWYRVRGWI